MSQNDEEHTNDHIEQYGDPGIASFDAPVAGWLKFNYIIWPIVGFTTMFLYWNGSHGWLDRGYWNQLQRAAGTTFPTQSIYEMELEKAKAEEQISEKK